MRKSLPIFALFFSLSVSLNAFASEDLPECKNECQKALIQAYFSKLSNVFKKSSTKNDVEQLFTLFDSQVKYEHFEYQANFDRKNWEAAFLRNLKRGAYSADKNSGLRVEKYIFGKHHTAVSYSYGVFSDDGKWTPKGDQNLFALFGFEGDKISLVKEYW